MKRLSLWFAIAAMALALGARATAAQEFSDAPAPVSSFFNDCAPFIKLGRGLSNFAFGWMEVPINMKYGYEHRDQAAGLFGGFMLGAAKGLGRTAIGLFETLTFWLPQPDYYGPILPPLEYFQRDHGPLPLE
jgi:putative exosortase-associated protein (TIGR04073 family)